MHGVHISSVNNMSYTNKRVVFFSHLYDCPKSDVMISLTPS